MNTSLLNNLVKLCAQKGIRDAILCPGSRSAPLTLAFSRNKNITCRTFSDERSAAFIALGIAQQTRTPVVLVCTSGSAAYNFAPAVAEAFFQQVPLIVITADRPREWIDQFDGQTIRQNELYGNHVKRYFELPHDHDHADSDWYVNRMVNEAINLSQAGLNGPVHINAPFREPLYFSNSETTNSESVRVIEPILGHQDLDSTQWSEIIKSLGGFNKILVVSGQHEQDPVLKQALAAFHAAAHWPVAGDILSNLHPLPFFCGHADTFLGQAPEKLKESLRPDLLITFGKSLVAKNLKLFLRTHKPREHWHLQTAGETADTFQGLTKLLPLPPDKFFSKLKESSFDIRSSWTEFNTQWNSQEHASRISIDNFFNQQEEGEFSLVKQLMESLPSGANLHLANSMAVRYANHIGLKESQKHISVFANRGTSGIDGCTSTAVGNSLASKVPNVLITGDLAFFYDRNAFWHNYPLPNLFVVVLNNHGGIIFNLIDGPSRQPEAEEFFITRQKLNAKSLAAEFGFTHHDASNVIWKEFFTPNGNVKILEIDSSQAMNKKVFEEFKKYLTKGYGA